MRQASCASATRHEWTLRRVADGTYFLVDRSQGQWRGGPRRATSGTAPRSGQVSLVGAAGSGVGPLRAGLRG
ncbi:hypothetical protein [Catellatospora methionotrophica]|uniref:hypothetical protein n=1 Tax=Catellatospora methionotrophica TaxID=121620 RepID=UPI003F4CDC12